MVAGGFDEEALDVGDELLHVLLAGIPSAHESAADLADECVELPADLAEGLDDVRGKVGEDRVGLGGEQDLDFGKGREPVVEEAGHGIGVGGVAEPGAVAEHADPGGGEETHLGAELARLLAAVIEFAGEFAIEEDDVKGLMRSGASDQQIAALIRKNIAAKWEGHEINSAKFVAPPRPMYSIGG